jgi:biopolymer transport protein ExbB
MKKLFALFTLLAVMSLGLNNFVYAQEGAEEVTEAVQDAANEVMEDAQEAAEEVAESVEEVVDEAPAAAEKEVTGFHQTVKKYFIEGDAKFMAFVLICLILGLALCIERIIYLNMATTNTRKLLDKVEDAMNNGGVDAAKEVCRNTSGPVAAIFYQGLDRANEDIEIVEKSIEQYGSVQMGLLEKGLSWISLFIAIAPMLGFMGTVFGMILAFDKIAQANTINAALVADGIRVALLTTVSGLIVAIILQVFYNYILAKIDGIVIDMEDASIELVDMLYKRKVRG